MPGTPARLQADAIDGLTTTNGAGEKRKITQLEDHLNDVSLDDELPPPPPPKRPRVKLPKLQVDERIQLTQDEMRASRQDYVQRQTELRERQDATKRKKEIDNWVAGMTSFKLFDTGNAEPWAVVVQVFEDKDQELAAFKASAQAEYRKTGRPVFAEDESESLGPLAMAALLHEMRQRSSSRAGSVQPAGILSEKARGKQRAISPRSALEAPMRMAQAGQHEAGSSASNAPATAPRRGSLSLSDILRGGNVQHQMSFGAGLGDGDNFMFDGGFEQGLGLRSRQGSFADAMPLYDAGGRAGPPPSDSLSSVGVPRQQLGHLTPLHSLVPWSQPMDGAEGIQSQDLGIKLPRSLLMSPGMASITRRSVTPSLTHVSFTGSMGQQPILTQGTAIGEAQDTQTTGTATESQVERDLSNFLRYASKLNARKIDPEDPLRLSDIAPVHVVPRTTACKACG
ncbi:hypothetical protein OC845_002713 [Tilletia horrida]|nr:hypothetical protein OC845_002713 [Tilletia horrida]